jgi:tetratricopeptide (TPR) repeat protein
MLSSESQGKKESTEAKPRFVERLAAFLQKYRVVLLVILIVLVLFMVVYFGWSEWNKRTRERSAVMAERAESMYEEWLGKDDESAQNSIQQDLDNLIDEILKRYPRQYAAQRARFIRANLAFENEQWQEAVENYSAIADSFPKSYLAPLSLFNAAVAYEQMDNLDQAIATYQILVDKHEDSVFVPHGLFSLGRLYESQEDYESAFQLYGRLEDEYPLSNWTKLGRNRIIELKVQGKIAQ